MKEQREYIITSINDGKYDIFTRGVAHNAAVYIRKNETGEVKRCTKAFLDKIMGAATWTIGGKS